MIEEEAIKRKFETFDSALNERTRRRAAAAEAMALGWGGISAVSRATGISQVTIRKGIQELISAETLSQGRIRQMGGGRKKTVSKDESLANDLEQLMEPVTRRDLWSPLRWTCKSLRQLAAELQDKGHQVSYPLVCELLRNLGYSLQTYREVRERGDYSSRDYRFAHLNAQVNHFFQVNHFISEANPVVSIDIMKKDILSDDINSEQLWLLPAQAKEEYINNSLSANTAFVTPYSMFEPAQNASWKKIRIDQDTMTFVLESLRHWWNEVGKPKYPEASMLFIATSGIGLHQFHAPLWKWELQRLADETQLKIKFCDVPAGTSKWCKIEHRLFAWIKQSVRGRSLTNYAIILRNIVLTPPNTELIVQCHLDTNTYHAEHKASNEEMSSIRQVSVFFPEDDWNYSIFPRIHSN